jgi:gas vesicle protein
MKDVSKVMLLLAAGFTAGAIAGILFAPDKGDETRKRIKAKAGELGEDVEKAYDEEIERLKDKINKLRSRFTDEVSNAINDVEESEVNVKEN